MEAIRDFYTCATCWYNCINECNSGYTTSKENPTGCGCTWPLGDCPGLIAEESGMTIEEYVRGKYHEG